MYWRALSNIEINEATRFAILLPIPGGGGGGGGGAEAEAGAGAVVDGPSVAGSMYSKEKIMTH